jgi:hypothetical protein
MKSILLTLIVLVLCAGCGGRTEQGDTHPPPSKEAHDDAKPMSPAAFVKAHPEFREDAPSSQPVIWRVSEEGTFSSHPITSAFVHSFEGTWTVGDDNTLHLSGTRSNGFTKTTRSESCVIRRIDLLHVWECPVVRLEKTVTINNGRMRMPTSASTATNQPALRTD